MPWRHHVKLAPIEIFKSRGGEPRKPCEPQACEARDTRPSRMSTIHPQRARMMFHLTIMDLMTQKQTGAMQEQRETLLGT